MSSVRAAAYFIPVHAIANQRRRIVGTGHEITGELQITAISESQNIGKQQRRPAALVGSRWSWSSNPVARYLRARAAGETP